MRYGASAWTLIAGGSFGREDAGTYLPGFLCTHIIHPTSHEVKQGRKQPQIGRVGAITWLISKPFSPSHHYKFWRAFTTRFCRTIRDERIKNKCCSLFSCPAQTPRHVKCIAPSANKSLIAVESIIDVIDRVGSESGPSPCGNRKIGNSSVVTNDDREKCKTIEFMETCEIISFYY